MDNENSETEIGDIEEAASPKNKQKRNYLSLEKKFEIMKRLKRYLAVDMDYYTMQEQIQKEFNIKISVGALWKMVSRVKEDLISTHEAWRIISVRVEKKKQLEQEALRLYSEAYKLFENEKKEEEPNQTIMAHRLKDAAYALKILKEVQDSAENFLSRFNLLPAMPVRQEIEVRPKIDTYQLIDILKGEENDEK